ncbi:MAG TPA: IPT/TIG domain-containing protein [Planctomycetota bacterium]|nr:IPT/TIG domain-containing protein [Planctomycetota bacterium]
MSRVTLIPAVVGALVSLASLASAQLAQSASFRLDDFAFAGGGAGEASAGFASFVALAPMSGAEVTSTSFRATFGFLGAFDPQPTNAPVIFGVTPDCGPLAGGTPLTVTGLNFDKFGSGPTVTVSIGGGAASGVAVASDTLLTCVSPPGTVGDKSVQVSSSFGSDVLAAGYHYSAGLVVFGTGTPGCAGPQLMATNSCPTVGNATFQLTCDHAPANALGLGLVGTIPDVTGSDILALGILLHVNLFDPQLLGLNFFSDASGTGFASLPIPAFPGLVGATVYGQAVWAWSGACPLPPFGLSSSMGLQITFEP